MSISLLSLETAGFYLHVFSYFGEHTCQELWVKGDGMKHCIKSMCAPRGISRPYGPIGIQERVLMSEHVLHRAMF